MTDNLVKFPKPATNHTSHLSTTTDAYVRMARLASGAAFVWMDGDTDACLRFTTLDELVRFIEELMAVATIWNEAGREA